jgi:hypothetical protein
MNKKIVLLDIICYAVVPYIIWTYGRDPMGDYWAIILSTVPGLIYTVYRFIAERQFNILGLFIIGSLILDTTVNLLSPSAERMLWNQVYLGYGYAILYVASILIKKPLALYFMVDYAYLMGYPRKNSIALYTRKELFSGFNWLTLLFVVRGIFQSSLKAWLLHSYGADAYGQMLIYLKISGWIFGGIVTIGLIVMVSKINKVAAELYGTNKQTESSS